MCMMLNTFMYQFRWIDPFSRLQNLKTVSCFSSFECEFRACAVVVLSNVTTPLNVCSVSINGAYFEGIEVTAAVTFSWSLCSCLGYVWYGLFLVTSFFPYCMKCPSFPRSFNPIPRYNTAVFTVSCQWKLQCLCSVVWNRRSFVCVCLILVVSLFFLFFKLNASVLGLHFLAHEL